MNTAIQYRYLIVLLTAIIVSLPFIGRGLFETSEGRYAMVAKTMNETQNYWMPKINGKDHLTKPPLTYWIIASGQKFFGMNTYGSRSMHMLAWLLVVLLMVRMGDLIADKETGLIAGLIFSTALFPSLGSWFLTTDPLLVLFQAISLWSILEFKKEERSIWISLFWIGLGLAFNTKGPVALFPLLFWIIFLKDEVFRMFKSPQILFFFALGSFWYVGLELRKSGIIVQLIQDELIKRSTTDFSGRNAFWWAPLVTYIIPLILGWGLWPMFLDKGHLKMTLQRKENRLYIIWIAVSLVVFSLIKSRLVLYILPLTIPVTIILSQALRRSSVIVAFSINLLILLGAKTFTSFYPYDHNSRQIADMALSTTKDEKVYFLNEYLYGVEFYMGPSFKRFSTHHGIFEALQKGESITWIAYRNKRKKIIDELTHSYGKEIIEHRRQGEWNLAKIRTTPSLHSQDLDQTQNQKYSAK